MTTDEPAELLEKSLGMDPKKNQVFLTKWMLLRCILYTVFAVGSWWLCSVIAPENKSFTGLSIWDIAYLACGLSGLVSLLLGEWGAMHKKYLGSWMLGMMLRGGTPVMILLWGRVNQMDWESRGIFISFGVAYLLTLFAETVLSVYLLQERYPKYMLPQL